MTVRIFGSCLISILLGTAGCGGDNGSTTKVVTVTNMNGVRLQGAAVVLGDSTGAMKTSGSTDGNGEITFPDAPANATITAAFSCVVSGVTVTLNSMDIRYDVNEPVTLRVNDCSPSSGATSYPTSPLGTVTVNIANAIDSVAHYMLYTSYIPLTYSTIGSFTTTTITIKGLDLQQDGKLSMYVIGQDASGTPVGYGMMLDQTFVDGMTMNVTIDKPFSFVQYRFTNLLPGATDICAYVHHLRTGKGNLFLSTCIDRSSSLSTETVNVPYIPGLGDQFSFSASAYAISDSIGGFSFTSQYLGLGPTVTLADQTFDFSQALTAPALSIEGADTATPALMWTGQDPAAERITLNASFHFNTGLFNVPFRFDKLSLARTSVRFPELPDSLSAFRPTGVQFYGINTYATGGGLSRGSQSIYDGWLSYPTRPGPVLKEQQYLQELLYR